MKRFLAGTGAAGLLGIAAAVAVVFFQSRPEGLSREDFNADVAAASDSTPVSPAAELAPAAVPAAPSDSLAMLRDAVASDGGMRGARMLPGPAGLARFQSSTEKVKGNALFQELVTRPAGFMLRRTHLGDPAKLKGFLRDPARIKKYLTHPVIRGVLENPALVKLLVKTPGVAAAFLSSPAMRDPATVTALSESVFLDRVLTSPGVTGAMSDPEVAAAVTGSPELTAYLASNPSGMTVLRKLLVGNRR